MSIYYNSKAEASQTDLGDTMLVEYLKAGLKTPALFKFIYQLPVMPETLKGMVQVGSENWIGSI